MQSLQLQLSWVDPGMYMYLCTHRSNDNISSDEQKTLLSLQRRTDIVINPVDKRSATVVMSKDDYLTSVMHQLDNTQLYEKLTDDPTQHF